MLTYAQVEAAHASDLRRIVLELKAMDAARLATTQAYEALSYVYEALSY
jgi:hypothetical protein